mmetsp:Transcript_27050/g.62531  ORF Transcript_27050/g.62531 Transcript_27050/m.62531 type:complete len:211 (-) Transcript_27050:687-1319(-)
MVSCACGNPPSSLSHPAPSWSEPAHVPPPRHQLWARRPRSQRCCCTSLEQEHRNRRMVAVMRVGLQSPLGPQSRHSHPNPRKLCPPSRSAKVWLSTALEADLCCALARCLHCRFLQEQVEQRCATQWLPTSLAAPESAASNHASSCMVSLWMAGPSFLWKLASCRPAQRFPCSLHRERSCYSLSQLWVCPMRAACGGSATMQLGSGQTQG